MAFKLRDYQQDAVDATVRHFRKTDDPAVIVLPTGAGKSLVIAELARIARRKILVLAHVKELVEQNHAKYEAWGLKASIYSAGLGEKDASCQVTFASVQSVARNLDDFSESYSLLIIDECHRVSGDDDSQYGQIIQQLKQHNSQLKVLGLTATPYRLGMGWIYRYHYHGYVRQGEDSPFEHCIYELPLRYMIRKEFLTPPVMTDAPIAQYDFASLDSNRWGEYSNAEVNGLLVRHPRVTQSICEQILDLAESRQGVMIFAATVEHAREIAGYLPADSQALITGDTASAERDTLIQRFKARELKFLVNVSVLTTGFDAPHVDLIAILRPTQSVSLYQQIVGRGLRLSEGKTDCQVIDYAGNGFDIYHPEVGSRKPSSDSEPVQVFCPACGFANIFWGKTDGEGQITEHFGRRCQGYEEDDAGRKQQCDYRFRFKECPHCNAENDIAARRCHQCDKAIVDPDDMLKDALKLKDALVLRCSGMSLSDHKGKLRLTYYDEDGAEVSEYFDLGNLAQRKVFNQQYGRRVGDGTQPFTFSNLAEVLQIQHLLRAPDFVVARKSGHHWRVKEKVFDYEGRYRKANSL